MIDDTIKNLKELYNDLHYVNNMLDHCEKPSTSEIMWRNRAKALEDEIEELVFVINQRDIE